MQVDRLVAEHYKKHWGTPIAAYELGWGTEEGQQGTFHIMEFGPTPDHDVWTYASVGMSKEYMPGQLRTTSGPPRQHRAELLVYSHPRCGELVEFLGQLVLFPFAKDTAISSGHSIPGTAPVVTGSPMTCVQFLYPHSEPEGFQPIRLSGEHIYILWAIPIYEVERQYKIAHGSDALARLFEEKDVHVWDLQRKPAL